MWICKIVCTFISRALFILLSLCGVFDVISYKGDPLYWCLTLLLLPLVLEMIITMKRRSGEDYRWFSPPIFLFLVSMIPSMWILELDYLHQKVNCTNEWDLERESRSLLLNGTVTYDEYPFKCHSPCQFKRTDELIFHQSLLILLILGRWLLPLGGGVTRDELSQLLLIFIGTAADILEFSDILDDVPVERPKMLYAILSVWTWSMLQFPLHMSVVSSKKDDGDEQVDQQESLWSKHSTDLWSIIESFFIQDGPFLVTRIFFLATCGVTQMLCFFAVKNSLVISLNLYRLVVICQNYRQSSSSSSSIELAKP